MLKPPVVGEDDVQEPPGLLWRDYLDTYAHVMAEQDGGERIGAEEQIVAARRALEHAETGVQLDLFVE